MSEDIWDKLIAESGNDPDRTEHWFGTVTGICTGCGATREDLRAKRATKFCPRPWRGNPPHRREVPDFTKEKP